MLQEPQEVVGRQQQQQSSLTTPESVCAGKAATWQHDRELPNNNNKKILLLPHNFYLETPSIALLVTFIHIISCCITVSSRGELEYMTCSK